MIDDVWKLTLAPYQKVLFKESVIFLSWNTLNFLPFGAYTHFSPHQNWNFSKFCFVKPLEYKRFFCLLNKECILSFTWNICRVFFSLQKYLSFACSFVVHAVNRARLRPIIMQSHFRPVENLCWAQHTNLNVWNITF